jgi:predicted GIY-YIG superfamily endonuclease
MHYVYLLESSSLADRRYIGITSDLSQHLKDHNQGKSSRTAKFLPWRLVTYIAFFRRTEGDAFRAAQDMPSPEKDFGEFARTESAVPYCV